MLAVMVPAEGVAGGFVSRLVNRDVTAVPSV
jgi:hypothetical protein